MQGVKSQVPNDDEQYLQIMSILIWAKCCSLMSNLQRFTSTRPKPAFGRQGLDWDCWARIQFSQVHFGAKLDSTDLHWSKKRHVTNTGPQPTSIDPKNVTLLTRGPNRPFRCLDCDSQWERCCFKRQKSEHKFSFETWTIFVGSL